MFIAQGEYTSDTREAEISQGERDLVLLTGSCALAAALALLAHACLCVRSFREQLCGRVPGDSQAPGQVLSRGRKRTTSLHPL